jgi:two-component system sensor histidine kinase PilS (NtrC family)
LKLQTDETRFTFRRRDLLRWLYLGRVTLVTGILAGALLQWFGAAPEQTFVATIVFMSAFLFTAGSFWDTHIRNREPGDNFVYGQAIFDALLVTAIVHITGGGGSDFAFLYILVISASALLLPLPGGVLVGVLATILYLADTLWLNLETFRPEVILQLALFATVAVITGWLGDRVRRAGLALGEVESELRRLRLDTGDILAHIGTGVLTVDGAGRLMYLNPAGEAILGVSAADWLGSKVLPTLDQVAPGMGTVLRSSIGARAPVARFKALARRGDAELVLGVSTTILDREAGLPPSVTAIFQDITDQDRLEMLNRRAERLEAVAELSASLAHEIKNPLASIRSAVEQISKPDLDGEDRATLERLVASESDRLSRLLSDFIDFSALRMGKIRNLDLAELARDCIALVKQNPEVGEGVRFRGVGLDRVLPIPGDGDLLHRVVFNLVLNAAQFAGSSGIVRVELQGPTECTAPTGTRLKDPVCLRIADSGPGVASEDLARIFDPFYTNRPGGSGLGLSLVHRAVEAHQGAVLVDRAKEGGAEFSIFLPGDSSIPAESVS